MIIGIFSKLFFFFGLTFFVLFLYCLSKKRNNLAVSFSMLCLVICIFITAYAFELQAKNVGQIMFFIQAEYFGAPFMAGFWLLFAYKFHFKKSAPADIILFIMMVPFITLFLSVTNDYHHLIYTSLKLIKYDDYFTAHLGKGLWYYANILYSYSAQILGTAIFYRDWKSKSYHIKTQSFWMFAGSVWPVIFNLFYITGISPMSLDFTPFGLGISAVFFYIAIFRYSFLQLQEIMKDVVFTAVGEGIMVIDNKNKLINYNQASRDILSWLDSSIEGIDISLFPEGKKILEQIEARFEIKVVKNREEKYYEFKRYPLTDHQAVLGFIYFIKDISCQKQLVQTLRDIASNDPLTEVFNRLRLMEELDKELFRMKRYGQCLSVLIIDIDHFKLVNDQYGYQAGNEVLKTLAQVCRNKIRKTDSIGRYGGEEFLIALPEATEDNACFVAECIRKTIEETAFLWEGKIIRITISIGIKTVSSCDQDINAGSLIQSAGKALYIAKKNGRNQTINQAIK